MGQAGHFLVTLLVLQWFGRDLLFLLGGFLALFLLTVSDDVGETLNYTLSFIQNSSYWLEFNQTAKYQNSIINFELERLISRKNEILCKVVSWGRERTEELT